MEFSQLLWCYRHAIQASANSGSLYYNCKKNFSIVLLAACDANYKFTLVHISEMGSNNDAGMPSESCQLVGAHIEDL